MPQKGNTLLQQQIISKTNLQLTVQPEFENFRQALANCVQDLINNDFNRLVLLLYRLDISEKKLKEQLAISSANAGLLIADMIIAREEEKAKSRQMFSSVPPPGDTEERW
ncbi:hypothetical protein [Foetidibacter luteolus]|uniref:hypothetical protein n=1 Tax=Foetidibacter luteolus TaxID=2608880 RepID=UPI00129A4737|nr:hypothetical protein [Foetidibacter luteolus]